MSKVVLVGYSGHALVVADLLLHNQYEVLGYFEKSEKENNPYGFKFLGSESDKEILKTYAVEKNEYCLGLGDNRLRKKVDEQLSIFPWRTISITHPNATIASKVKIGVGTLIFAGAIINPFVEIGRGCIINTGSILEHECRLGDYVHIAPGAVLAGNVSVGNTTFIGANATIKQGVRIGNNVIVGAGAVVLKDVPNDQTWVGNPAKCIA